MPRYGPEYPHPLSTLHGEFVWEGKYDVHGRRRGPALPATPPRPEPRERWNAPAGPGAAAEPNVLLAGDNLLALAALLPAYRGRVQLVYLDPPFDTGVDHTMRVPVGGGNGHRDGTGARGLELVAYRDAWGPGAGSYLQRMAERLTLMRELLSPSGLLCLHCDWRSHAPLRLVLDEVFGAERFVNEIVWHYYNKYSAGARRLPRAHDTLLLYARGPRPALEALRLPREAPYRQLVRENVAGVLRNARDAQGRLRYRLVHDRKADDVWRIPQLQPASREWSGYATQKHHALLERLLAVATRPGDLVADFFCGAGTTLAVAERMGRRWIGCDQGALALHSTRKRLLRAREDRGARDASPQAAPFTIASLAPAVRREWLARAFVGDPAACRRHVLAAFGAEPLPDGAAGALHGRLEDGVCALPELDGPCTAEHARVALRAARAAGAERLYLLAWDFDARLWSALEGRRAGPELVPMQVPEALATPEGNAPPVFRGLPRVTMQARPAPRGRSRTLSVTLQAYRPGPARPAWSGGWEPLPDTGADPLALLDGWALDPAWRPGAEFTHRWWSFRTPHQRTLAACSDPLALDGGQPCVLTTDVWGVATLHAPPWPATPRTEALRSAAESG